MSERIQVTIEVTGNSLSEISKLIEAERADDMRRLLAYVEMQTTMFHRPAWLCTDATFRTARTRGYIIEQERKPYFTGYRLTSEGLARYRELMPGTRA